MVDPAEVSGLQRAPAQAVAPFLAIEVDVRRSDEVVYAGVAGRDGQTEIVAAWDPVRGRLRLEVVAGGTREVVRTRRLRLGESGVLRLALVLCENRATVLVSHGEGGAWTPVMSDRAAIRARLDLRDPALLAELDFVWGARAGSVSLGPVRAGVFGMIGLRDPHLVQHADGSAYEVDGRQFMTWTCAGAGSFRQAHMGIFSFDPAVPDDLRAEGHLFFRRGGQVLGDHAGQMVRDGDRWLVVTSSWGDFHESGVQALRAESRDDLLHGVHVLDASALDLPTPHSSWDPGLARVDGQWLVSFVASPSQQPFRFHPALAAGSAESPWEGLELVGADAGLRHTEGPLLTRTSEGWRVLASDGHARRYPIYDLAMNQVGELNAPWLSNIPHPLLVEGTDGEVLMVTFDDTDPWRTRLGYGGHGDVVVMVADR